MRSDDIRKLKRLARLQIITMIVAVIGLAGVVGGFEQARVNARKDSCRLIRHLILAGTPTARRPLVRAYLTHTELANCNRYAGRLL